MIQISSDFLKLSSEPIVMVKNERIVYTNNSAAAILSADAVGRSLRDVFGAELANCQGASFICRVSISGKSYFARVIKSDGMKAVFLRPYNHPASAINDAVFFSLRNQLMNSAIATNLLRTHIANRSEADIDRQLLQIDRSHYHAQRILSNITVLRTMSLDKPTLCAYRFDLQEHILRTIDVIQAIHPAFSITFAKGEPVFINADPSMLSQLLINLISNSFVHGGDKVHVRISVLTAPQNIILTVSDDGCGIAPEDMHFVLDRYTMNNGSDTVSMNSGLGLTVVRMIAELHNGSLLLESRKVQGTTVRVTISRALSSTLGSGSGSEPDPVNAVLTGLSGCLPAEAYRR